MHTHPPASLTSGRLADVARDRLDLRGPAEYVTWRAWLEAGRVDEAMPAIAHGMNALRLACSADEWAAALEDPGLVAVRTLLHEDPYTRRGFEKPRGYAGDAVLLDHIYGMAPLPESTTPLGRAVYAWCDANSEAWRAVRRRRSLLAAEIDEAAARVPGARVLAVACGHLREASLSRALVGGDIRELVALDQDVESLRVVAASCAGLPVTLAHASVSDVLRKRVSLGDFDLVYAAGLYDYLEPALARALTARLWTSVRPGGRFLTANFADIWERGYIESMMRWRLIYRTGAELRALAPDDPGARVTVDRDADGVIEYLRIDSVQSAQ